MSHQEPGGSGNLAQGSWARRPLHAEKPPSRNTFAVILKNSKLKIPGAKYFSVHQAVLGFYRVHGTADNLSVPVVHL